MESIYFVLVRERKEVSKSTEVVLLFVKQFHRWSVHISAYPPQPSLSVLKINSMVSPIWKCKKPPCNRWIFLLQTSKQCTIPRIGCLRSAVSWLLKRCTLQTYIPLITPSWSSPQWQGGPSRVHSQHDPNIHQNNRYRDSEPRLEELLRRED